MRSRACWRSRHEAAERRCPDNRDAGHGADAGHGPSVAGMEIPAFLVSKKAQQIEFFSFLTAIGLGIIIPEFVYKPKMRSKSEAANENQQAATAEIKPESPSLTVVSENAKTLTVATNNTEKADNTDTIEFKNQGEQDQQDQKAA